MWIDTPAARLLKIQYPIVQGPFGGGASSVQLAAAVSNLGGLGSFWGVVAAALFNFVVSFGNLEVSLFLVGPGRTTLPIAILQYLEWKIDPTIAAVSLVQIAVIAGLMLLTNRFVRLSQGL